MLQLYSQAGTRIRITMTRDTDTHFVREQSHRSSSPLLSCTRGHEDTHKRARISPIPQTSAKQISHDRQSIIFSTLESSISPANPSLLS